MFGISYSTEDGKVFKPFNDLEEAQNAANNIACMGIEVTVYDYDISTGEYIEFYTI